MSATQPRQPAGSPEGGQFASTAGTEASLSLEWEGLPDGVVTVRGGLGESNGSVRVIDLDVLDDTVQEDWALPILLADARVLREHGYDYDAKRLEDHVAWHRPEISNEMREELEESYKDRNALYAVVEGGLVQYQAEGVTVIDMDVTDSAFPDKGDVEYGRETAGRADAAGVPSLARELREWADATENELVARAERDTTPHAI